MCLLYQAALLACLLARDQLDRASYTNIFMACRPVNPTRRCLIVNHLHRPSDIIELLNNVSSTISHHRCCHSKCRAAGGGGRWTHSPPVDQQMLDLRSLDSDENACHRFAFGGRILQECEAMSLRAKRKQWHATCQARCHPGRWGTNNAGSHAVLNGGGGASEEGNNNEGIVGTSCLIATCRNDFSGLAEETRNARLRLRSTVIDTTFVPAESKLARGRGGDELTRGTPHLPELLGVNTRASRAMHGREPELSRLFQAIVYWVHSWNLTEQPPSGSQLCCLPPRDSARSSCGAVCMCAAR